MPSISTPSALSHDPEICFNFNLDPSPIFGSREITLVVSMTNVSSCLNAFYYYYSIPPPRLLFLSGYDSDFYERKFNIEHAGGRRRQVPLPV